MYIREYKARVASLMWNVVAPYHVSLHCQLAVDRSLKVGFREKKAGVEGSSVASGGSQCRPPVRYNKCLSNIPADTAGSMASGSRTAEDTQETPSLLSNVQHTYAFRLNIHKHYRSFVSFPKPS